MKLPKLSAVWLCLFVTLSCAPIVIPDVEWCVEAAGGALCQNSISDRKRRLDLNGWLDFLQANPDTNKGPALCTSSLDFARLKTALEQLCVQAGKSCTFEHRLAIAKLNNNAQGLIRDGFAADTE